jgi:hypothetical protein
MKTADEIRVDIVSLIEARFGSTGQDIIQKLMSLADMNTLRNLYEHAAYVESFEEFICLMQDVTA